MITAYIPPTKWWRREHSIQVPVWPRWLAQWICPHVTTHVVAWGDTEQENINACSDCYRWHVRQGAKHFDAWIPTGIAKRD